MPLCVATLAMCTAVGGYVARLPLHAQLTELRAAHAGTAKLQALAAAKVLQQAQTRGDVLSTALATTQTQLLTAQKARHAALQPFTTGRACLGADAVRVLNAADTGASAGLEPVPPPPGGAAATGASFATDADVGHWAIGARAGYDDCRARLGALIDWHTTQGTP